MLNETFSVSFKHRDRPGNYNSVQQNETFLAIFKTLEYLKVFQQVTKKRVWNFKRVFAAVATLLDFK